MLSGRYSLQGVGGMSLGPRAGESRSLTMFGKRSRVFSSWTYCMSCTPHLGHKVPVRREHAMHVTPEFRWELGLHGCWLCTVGDITNSPCGCHLYKTSYHQAKCVFMMRHMPCKSIYCLNAVDAPKPRIAALRVVKDTKCHIHWNV